MKNLFNHSYKQFIFAIAHICLLFGASFATAPTNDNLSTAVLLSGTSGSIAGTNVDASRQTGENNHFGGADSIYRTVWFKWTSPAAEPVVFEVTSATGFDSAIAIYTGAAFPLATISRNNDTFGNRPRLEFTAEAGTTYFIVVGTYNTDSASGNFELSWQQSSTPSNDMFANALKMNPREGEVIVTNVNATVEAGEQMPFGQGKTIWLKYENATTTDHSLTVNTSNSWTMTQQPGLCVYSGNSVDSIARIVCHKNIPGTSQSRVVFNAKAGMTYWIEFDQLYASTPPGNSEIDWTVTKQKHFSDFKTIDFNGGPKAVRYDDAADIAVFRPSNGTWYYRTSLTWETMQQQFGLEDDKPVPADYDGDGFTDLAVVREEGGFLTWYIRYSYDDGHVIQQWGLPGDKAVPGDYDYDGRMDMAVFRPSNGTWYVIKSSNYQMISVQWGQAGDIPVQGDFAGTSTGYDFAVFRPSNGHWYITNLTSTVERGFGLTGDVPVAADYNNDGKHDLAVYRPSNGNWYQFLSSWNETRVVSWGLPGDIPQTGDFDANSNNPADFAVYRPSDNTWHVLGQEGTRVSTYGFGLPGDIPVSSIVIQ